MGRAFRSDPDKVANRLPQAPERSASGDAMRALTHHAIAP